MSGSREEPWFIKKYVNERRVPEKASMRPPLPKIDEDEEERKEVEPTMTPSSSRTT